MTTAEQPKTRPPGGFVLTRMLPPAGPGRLLVLCTGIASLGNGLYVTGGAVYFVRVVGLSPGQVGLAFSIAGIAALVLGIPVGYFADRFGPRGTTAVLALAKAVMLVSLAFIHSFPLFLLAAAGHGLAEQTGHVARGALISGVMGREGRVRLSAYMRAVFNGGFALASLASGLIIAVDSPGLYRALFFANAATMVVVSGMYLRLPAVPGQRRAPAPDAAATAATPDRSALKDLPYILVAQISGLARIGPTILALGVPLWLVTRTEAPRALAAWVMLINTVMVVFLQVRLARDADSIPGATRLQRLTFLVLALACVVAGITGAMPGWLAGVVLAVASVLFTLGEIWGEAARWGLRYELAPAHAQGRYGGVFATGDALATIAGPALATTIPGRFGVWGWLALTVLFLGSLTVNRSVIDWAVRTRAEQSSNLEGAPA